MTFRDTRIYTPPTNLSTTFPERYHHAPQGLPRPQIITIPTSPVGDSPIQAFEPQPNGPIYSDQHNVVNETSLPPDMQAFLDAFLARIAKIWEPLRYANFTNQAVTVTTDDQIALSGTDSIRAALLVMNIDTTNTLFFAFGSAATAATAVPLSPGQGFFFDAVVPQNDLHLSASATPTAAMIMYANKSLGA